MEDRANLLKQMKICRFCLSSDENELSEIQNKDVKISTEQASLNLPPLSLQIMACISIEVVKNDNMPQYICSTCRNLTNQAYIFKSNCKKADDALKLFLATGQLSKPCLQQVVQIKVQPSGEKYIHIINEDENKKTQVTGKENDPNEQMEFVEELEVETLSGNVPKKDQPVHTIETQCYPCTECDRSFPLKQLLDIHMTNHTRERSFECMICQNRFFTKYDLHKHLLTHEPEKEYPCSICNKVFAREHMLKKHEKTHVNIPKHKCVQCDKTFLNKEYLEFHMGKHERKKPFTCNICNKSFVFKQGLERHEVVHSENKPHKCNYCEASFTTAIKLTRHITSHAGLRPYPCKICGRTFLLSHHLTRHMRSHYTAQASLDTVGQYKCDICSMSFKKKDSLINHSVIHSMVNLKCVICNTTFESADLVKEHITTHLSGLPFSCEKCDYSFETAEQLEVHELKHAEMEYEDQIEKEILSEVINQHGQPNSDDDDNYEDDHDAEYEEEFTIVDINNPESGLKRSRQRTEAELNKESIRIDFLKDEIMSEEEHEEEIFAEPEPEPIESIKPIVRQEGTKVYQRKSTSTGVSPHIRLSSLNPIVEQKQIMKPVQHQSTDLPISAGKSSIVSQKIGDKVVKVQKFILTKDEMKAMAKKGIIEVKNGQVVVKSGSQQILNATLKPIQKNEIDSLLDKRQNTGKVQIKRYEKKISEES